MARKIRIEYDGAFYHVMARGNQGQIVYADDYDRKQWLETLGEACEKTGWRVHAWVMMGNHYHLLLETPEANLVSGMKWFQGTYTQRYNARHEVFGHLFQGRYKALLVDGAEGNYLAILSTYIHLNPARAGMIQVGKEKLRSYPWSSYPDYVKASGSAPDWLETDRVIGSHGLEPEDILGYEAYVEGRVLELGEEKDQGELTEQWNAIRRSWCLGDAAFKKRMLKLAEGSMQRGRKGSYSGEAKREHGEAEAERLLAKGLSAFKLEEKGLSDQPKGTMEKQVLAWWLSQNTTASRRWVSERLHMGDESRVSQAIRRVKLDTQAETGELIKRLAKIGPKIPH